MKLILCFCSPISRVGVELASNSFSEVHRRDSKKAMNAIAVCAIEIAERATVDGGDEGKEHALMRGKAAMAVPYHQIVTKTAADSV